VRYRCLVFGRFDYDTTVARLSVVRVAGLTVPAIVVLALALWRFGVLRWIWMQVKTFI